MTQDEACHKLEEGSGITKQGSQFGETVQLRKNSVSSGWLRIVAVSGVCKTGSPRIFGYSRKLIDH